MPCQCPYCRKKNTWLLVDNTISNHICDICCEVNNNNTITNCCGKNICYKCIILIFIKEKTPLKINCKLCCNNIVIDNYIHTNEYNKCNKCNNHGNIKIVCCNKYYCYRCIHNIYLDDMTIEIFINYKNCRIKKIIDKQNLINNIIIICNNICNNSYYKIFTSIEPYEFISFSMLELTHNYNILKILSEKKNIILYLYSYILSDNDNILINNIINNDNNNEQNIKLYQSSTVLNNDKYIILNLIPNYSFIYKTASITIKSDRDIIEKSILYDYKLFEFIPDRIKSDITTIKYLSLININIIEFIDINKSMVQLIIDNVNSISNKELDVYIQNIYIQKIKSIVELILSKNGLLLKYVNNTLRDDKTIVQTAINNNGMAYEFISDKYKYDYDISIAALLQNVNSFKFFHKLLKTNTDIINIAIKQGVCIQYINRKYLYNREILLEGLKKNLKNVLYIPMRYIDDLELYKDIITFDPICLKYIYNYSILFNILKDNNYLFVFLSLVYKSDRNFIEKILNDLPLLFKYILTKFKNDKELVLKVVKKNGLVLQFINNKLSHDDDIITAAITQNINAKKYICKHLVKKYL